MGLPIFVSPRKTNDAEPSNYGDFHNQRQHRHSNYGRPQSRFDGGAARPGLIQPLSMGPRMPEGRNEEGREDELQTASAQRTQSFMEWLIERNRGRDRDEARAAMRRAHLEASDTDHVEEAALEYANSFPSLTGTNLEELRDLLEIERRDVANRQSHLFSVVSNGLNGMVIAQQLREHRRYLARIEERILLLREQLDEDDGAALPDFFRLISPSVDLDDLDGARADLERSRDAVRAMRRLLAGAEDAPSVPYLDVVFTVSMDHATLLYLGWLRRRLEAIRNNQYLREHPEATGYDRAPM